MSYIESNIKPWIELWIREILILCSLPMATNAFATDNCVAPALEIIGDAETTICSDNKVKITFETKQTNSAPITDVEWYYRYGANWYLLGGETGLSITVDSPKADIEYLMLAYNGDCVSDSIFFKASYRNFSVLYHGGNMDLCEGDGVIWTLNISSTNGDSVYYYFGDNPVGYRDSFILRNILNDTVVPFYATYGYCKSEMIYDTFYVEKLGKISLAASKDKVCRGDEVELMATVENTAASWIYWMKRHGSDEDYSDLASGSKTTIKVNVNESTDYVAVLDETYLCPSVYSDPVTVDVTQFELSSSPYPNSVCYNEPVELEALVLDGSPTSLRWEKNGKKLDELDGKTTVTVNETESLGSRNNNAHTDYYNFIATDYVCSDTLQFAIQVAAPLHFTFMPIDNTVCEGDRPNFNIEGVEPEDLIWYHWTENETVHEFDYFNEDWGQHERYVGYQVKLKEPKMCYYEYSSPFMVSTEKKPSFTLDSLPVFACAGQTIDLNAICDDSYPSTEWRKNGETIAQNETHVTDVATENATYEFEVFGNKCPSEKKKAFILVHEAENLRIISNKSQICKGDEVDLSVAQDWTEDIIWGRKLEGESSFKVVKTDAEQFTDRPSKNATYRLRGSRFGCKATPVSYTIEVTEPIELDLEDISICAGESVLLSASKNMSFQLAKWTSVEEENNGDGNNGDVNGSENLVSMGNTVRVAPNKTTKYDLWVEHKGCKANSSMTVYVNETPHILSHEIIDATSCQLSAEGALPLYFSINGEGTSTSEIITDLLPGRKYEVEVSNEVGCSSIYTFTTPRIVVELEFPRYFYQGEENWKIGNIDKYSLHTLYIYDRFGKFLTKIENDPEGWDGTYLGYKMPTTDYWFVVDLPEIDKQLTGHFTLMRR